jgi:predicted  nucleic acid-binding Zn-ribbon protein
MRDQILVLDTLQRIDMELSQLEKNLKEYPEQISTYESEIEAFRERLENSKKIKEEILKKKSRIELDIAQNEDTIKKSEQKLFEIKTHKEYEALQKQIAESKRNNAELEDNLLQEMEKLEGLESRISSEEEELGNKENEYNSRIADFREKIEELKVIYQPKTEEKKKIASGLDRDLLSVYERVKKRNGYVLALAKNEVCTGCNMNIPAQLFNEVLTLSRLIQCPNCLKFLYTEEELKSEAKTG